MIDTPVRASAAETEPCAAVARDADGDHVVGEPWIWSQRNALPPDVEPQPLAWSRVIALALTLALHLAVLLLLTVPPSPMPPASTRDTRGPAIAIGMPPDRLWVVFVEPAVMADPGDVAIDAIVAPLSPALTPDPMPSEPHAPATPPAPSAMALMSDPRAVASPATVEPRDAEVLPSIADASVPAARLFRPDGSVALPAAVIAALHAVESEDRAFDYITPGLADAASAFSRLPTLPYEPTSLDADWKPVRTLAEDIIIPISEMLTYQNKRKSIRCSVLPPVCTWGRADAPVELDDPYTLNPIEDAQCQGLWDSIVAATNQGEWLRLRRRFDAECRKLLERDRSPPVPRAVKPAPG